MCENPIDAWLDTSVVTESGKHPLVFSLSLADRQSIALGISKRYKGISVPCGKCFSCRRDRAWQVTVRASFESRLYDDNSFITLTCADSHLPEVFPHGVEHRPWQLFAKRLRKKIGSFRFLMCAEYGSKTNRPHYHAIIFGHSFTDVGLQQDGSFVPSLTIASCWPHGHVQVSAVNEHRVAYVAGYTLKDYQLGRDSDWYAARGLNLPYVKWSRRPGLGFAYFERHFRSLVKHKDVWLHNDHYDQFLTSAIFSNSERLCNCRYFSEKLALLSPELYDKIQVSKENPIPRSDVENLVDLDKRMRQRDCRLYALEIKERDISMSHNVGNVNER